MCSSDLTDPESDFMILKSNLQTAGQGTIPERNHPAKTMLQSLPNDFSCMVRTGRFFPVQIHRVSPATILTVQQSCIGFPPHSEIQPFCHSHTSAPCKEKESGKPPDPCVLIPPAPARFSLPVTAACHPDCHTRGQYGRHHESP